MSNIKTYRNLIYLTERRGLFIGHIPPSMRSAQASPVLLVNLLGYFHVDIQGKEVKSKTVLVRAGMEVVLSSRDLLVADFMLDRIEPDYERIKQQMQAGVDGLYFGLKDETIVSNILLDIYERECDLKEALKLILDYFDRTTPMVPAQTPDPRIRKIVNIICDKPFENSPLEQLALQVNLSVPRLVELFKHEMGVPIRKYRIWRRFFAACEAISTQRNFTEAAHAAGFTDSAHFCKHFKDMFGVSPKAIFRPETQIVIKT